MINYEPSTSESAPQPSAPAPLAQPATTNESLAKIVHELRNPLAAFTSALHLLGAQPDRPDVVRQLVGMMSQQLNHLTRIVNDLSEISRPSSRQSPLATEQLTADPSPEPLPTLKIMLVDDNQSATHMMSRLLEKLGQVVNVAGSAAVALLQIPNFAPDIVISDIAMPGMSGYELARRICELKLPKRPYLVAITGYGQESDRQEALTAGFNMHLTKPVGVGALENLIRTRCGDRVNS